jgi:succinoglycan biosynthesis transport protein ExoP
VSLRNTTTVQSPRPADPVIVDSPQRATPPNILDAESFGTTVTRRWKLVLATAAIVTILATILAALQPKHYRASVIAGVTATGDRADAGDLYRGVEVLQQRTIIATVAALASLPETMRQAFSGFPGTKAYTIDGVVLPNTNLIRIDVEGTDPVAAARIANRVPSILASQTQAMYKLYGVATVSEATAPTRPVSPRIARVVVVGAILGLLLGMAAAVAKSYMRQEKATARLTNAAPAS